MECEANSDTVSTDNSFSNQTTLKQNSFSLENLKNKFIEKLESYKENAQDKSSPIETESMSTLSTLNTMGSNISDNATPDKMEVIWPTSNTISGEKPRPFQPNIAGTIEAAASIGFNYGGNTYNQKHNMVIACPSNSTALFYDAATHTAIKERKIRYLDSSVVQMSYCAETDTHLLGCAFGDIYTYNVSEDSLTKIAKEGDSFILAITFLTPTTFAFSSSKSNTLFFATIDDPNLRFGLFQTQFSKDSDAWYLHHNNEQKILLSGLANGKVAVYNTRKPNKYPMLDSLQAHKQGKYVTCILSIKINGRDFVVTGANDHTIKLWHFVRGKMRLLKVIQTTDDVSTLVYLEEYKMIASTHHRDYIKFFRLPSGKLEHTLNMGLGKARNIFFMPDKNQIGVADLSKNIIRVVQLHPEDSNTMNK